MRLIILNTKILIILVAGCGKDELIYREHSNDYIRIIDKDQRNIRETYDKEKKLIFKRITLKDSNQKYTLSYLDENDTNFIESISYKYDDFSLHIRFLKNGEINSLNIIDIKGTDLNMNSRTILFKFNAKEYDSFGYDKTGKLWTTEEYCKKHSKRLCEADYQFFIDEGLRLKNIEL